MIALLRTDLLLLAATLLVTGCGARSAVLDAFVSTNDGNDGAVSPNAERCNGLDDDGDGQVDEGIADQTCGIGACRVTVPGCRDGKIPACQPRPATPERCDQLDNDCNGLVDDGLPFGPLGQPIIVRDRELSTGSCTSCRWALRPRLVETATAMASIFVLGFNGMKPQTNTYARHLDQHGRPLGPAQALWESQQILTGPRIARSDERIVLAFDGRFGGDDKIASAALDLNLSLTASPTPRPVPEDVRLATRHEPEVVQMGENRSLLAWLCQGHGASPSPIHDHSLEDFCLELIDSEGKSIRSWRLSTKSKLLPLEGVVSLRVPSMAARNGRAVLATVQALAADPQPTRQLLLFVFDQDGSIANERAIPLKGELTVRSGELVINANNDDGWIVQLVNTDCKSTEVSLGRLVWRLDGKGDPVGGVGRHEAELCYRNIQSAARPGGGYVFLADGHALTLDQQGNLLARGVLDTENRRTYLLVRRDGRIFVTYPGPAPDKEPNQLFVRELGCLDP